MGKHFSKESNHQFRFVAETLNGEIVGFIDGGEKELVHTIGRENYMRFTFYKSIKE